MSALAAISLLVACGSSTETPAAAVDRDPSLMRFALDLADPEVLLDLVDDPATLLGLGEGCPTVEDVGGIEVWTGGCATPDGAWVDGHIRRVNDTFGWFAAENFTIRDADGLQVRIDGAVELSGEGELLVVDATVSMCGLGPLRCEEGSSTVDLTTTLYPVTGYPNAYDATVTGVIAGAYAAPVTIDAAWSIDTDRCATEPASGTFAISGAQPYSLELDGASACDGCARWAVRGVAVDRFCGF